MNKSFFFLINRFQNHIILTNSIDYIYDSKRSSLLARFNITTVYRESERNNVKFWILSTIQYATIKRQWATTIAKRSTLFPFGKYFSFLLLFLSFLLPPFSRNEITVSIFNRFLFIIHFDRKTLSLSLSLAIHFSRWLCPTRNESGWYEQTRVHIPMYHAVFSGIGRFNKEIMENPVA